MAIARTTLTAALAVQDELAIVGGQEWVRSGVGLLKGLLYQFATGTDLDFVVGSETTWKDLTVWMSGSTLNKGGQNQFGVDASLNAVQIQGWIMPSTVGPTTAVSSLPVNTAAFYITGAGSLGIAFNSAGDNVHYGKLTDSVVAY